MNCRICKEDTNLKTFKLKEMMFGLRDEFEYFQCSNCGCLQIKNIPENIEKYYPENYYSFSINPQNNDGGFKTIPISIRNKFAVHNKHKLLGKFLYGKFPRVDLMALRNIKNLHKDMSILDVGCGDGFCLYELKKMGFNNLLGVDPYIKANIKYPNGLEILKSELSEISQTFDLVMMHHVLEHLENQHKFFEEIHSKLNENGLFLIRIPVLNYAWEKYKEDWVQLDAPRHFYLHTEESIKYLAKKYGFDIEEIIYDSNEFQLWGSEQYKKDIPLYDEKSNYKYQKNGNSTFTDKEISNFKKEAEELNRTNKGDQAIFILKKR